MKIIKGTLKEELQNSLRQEKAYTKAIAAIAAGSLVKKKIKGRIYYYLVLREGGKVKFIYKGKLSKEEVQRHKDNQKMRAKYKQLLSQVRKQISFLRKALRAREIRSV